MQPSFLLLSTTLFLSALLPTTTQQLITPPTPEESTGLLEGDKVQIRFSDQLPVPWVFPKTSQSELSGNWFYFKPAFFRENECQSYRNESWPGTLDFLGELLNCSSVFALDLVSDNSWQQEELTEGYGYAFKRWLREDETGNGTSLTIQYILFDENGSNVTMRNVKGTERILKIGSHAIKMNILWDNWTTLAPSEAEATNNSSKTTYPQFSLVFEMGFSDVYEVTELMGVTLPGLVSIDKDYFRSLNVSLNDGEWTVKVNLANFSVSDPPTISSLVREEEQWGFEQVNIDYLQVLLLSNRTFSFVGTVPAAKSVLYDPDFTVLFSGEDEDERAEKDEDGDEWLIPVVVVVPLAIAFVVVFILGALVVRVLRSRREKLNSIDSSTGAVNFE